MLKKWIREPSFWIFVVLAGLFLFLVLQASVIIAKLVFQAIGIVGKIPQEYLKYGGLTTLSLFAGYLLYRFWPEAKEKTAGQSTPEEKKKPDPPKNDAKDKKTSDGNGCILPALIILLAVVLGGTFWKDEFSSLIQNINTVFKKNYVLGSVSRWDTDIKTGKPLSPKTFSAKIMQWDEKRIFIKIEGKNPVTMEWDKGLTNFGKWYQEGRSGTWWIPNMQNSDGLYAGWSQSDGSSIKEPMIIRKP